MGKGKGCNKGYSIGLGPGSRQIEQADVQLAMLYPGSMSNKIALQIRFRILSHVASDMAGETMLWRRQTEVGHCTARNFVGHQRPPSSPCKERPFVTAKSPARPAHAES
jgi:hypothetical protein